MENYPHLSIEVVWEDSDLEKLLISASNGRYSGIAQVYFGRGDIKDLADRIRGFPQAVSQEVIFSGGAEDSDGFARLVFSCVDGVGHTIVKVSLAEVFQEYARPTMRGRVELELLFEPLALDEFARDLQQMARRKVTRALLRGNDAQQTLGADSP
jgi:hypothetical protein